jgi:hypothetical protein
MALKHDGIKAINGLVTSLTDTLTTCEVGKYQAVDMQSLAKNLKELSKSITTKWPKVKGERKPRVVLTGDAETDMINYYKRYAAKIDPELVNDPIFNQHPAVNNVLYKHFKALKDAKAGVAPKEPKAKAEKPVKAKEKAPKEDKAKAAYEEMVKATVADAAPAGDADDQVPIDIDSFMDDTPVETATEDTTGIFDDNTPEPVDVSALN